MTTTSIIIIRFVLVVSLLLLFNFAMNKMYEVGYKQGYSDRGTDIRNAWIAHMYDEKPDFNREIINTLDDHYRGRKYKLHKQRHN